MKQIRRNVFETNSSSTHSVSISSKNSKYYASTSLDAFIEYDNKVHIRFGEFGWEIEDYNLPYDKLHPYTELAIGGGNPLEHPDLVPFLEKCKRLNLIPSMTVNQVHFMKNRSFLKGLVEQKLIYGLGVSLVRVTNDFIDALKEFPNAVIHVINGLVNPLELEALSGEGLKILILGYKQFRRGEKLYQEQGELIEEGKTWLYKELPQIISEGWFEVVSFDNLAIKQLDAQRLMPNEDWEQFYMGDDGSATMYVDMVNREFAKSSTSTERYPLEDDIIMMFEKIRTN